MILKEFTESITDLLPLMEVTKKYYSTKEMAKELGVSGVTIHKWCLFFSIQVKRSRRNFRMLSLEDVTKLRYIAFMRSTKRITRLGILLDTSQNGWPDPERVAAIIDNYNTERINKIKGI
jgi:DNA-binding transcriptional MerR regulator